MLSNDAIKNDIEEKLMQILIGADIVPTKSNIDIFNSGNGVALVGQELLELLNFADYRIFNLEAPLSDVFSPIEKNGPVIAAPTSTIAGYRALGIDCVTIANNHIMDQGKTGFLSTIKTLDKSEIAHLGGGETVKDAAKPHIIQIEGKKIGVYACAEHEFSIAGERSAGANPFDALESLDHVLQLKSECDYVIVLYHGGKEHYRYPSPNLQKTCRKLVEKGADLVVCQHSHCIGCEEKYQEGTIVYGQGNFLFDYSENEVWKTGLLIKITDDFKIEHVPVKKVENTVRLALGDDKEEILSAFRNRSEEIKVAGFVEEEYAKFAYQMIYRQMVTINNPNKFFIRVANKITGGKFLKWYIDRKYRMAKYALKNIAECESLRELFVEGINYIGE